MKISLLLYLLPIISLSQNNILETAKDYFIKKQHVIPEEFLFISIKNQYLYHIKKNNINKKYIISSSEKGIGNKSGSNKTPIGIHVIKQKALSPKFIYK